MTASGSKDGCHALLDGADMLFDNVRSKAFAVLSQTLIIIEFLLVCLYGSRREASVVARYSLYGTFYHDCFDESTTQSSFAQHECDGHPISGWIYEVLINILAILVSLPLISFINSPGSNKCIGAVCFSIMAIPNLCQAAVRPFMTILETEDDIDIPKLWYDVIYLLGWLCLWALFFKLVCCSTCQSDYVTDRDKAALKHTRSLLKPTHTDLPVLQQRMADALRPVVPAALLAECSLAAAEAAMLKFSGPRIPEPKASYIEHLKSKLRCSGRKSRATALPILACVGALLALTFMSYGALQAIWMSDKVVSGGQSAVDTIYSTQDKMRSTAKQLLDTTDHTFTAWESVMQSYNMTRAIGQMSESMKPAIQSLKTSDPDAAANLETLLRTVNNTIEAIAPMVPSISSMLQTAKAGAGDVFGLVEEVIDMTVIVPDVLQVILNMASTCATIAFFVAIATSCMSVHFMLWRLAEDGEALRKGQKMPKTQEGGGDFHPVRASSLPGMMMSSIFFGLILSFLLTFLVILGIWLAVLVLTWAPWLIWNLLRMGSGIGLSFVVKSFVLDKFVGRRLLTNRNFITHWKTFNFYTLFTIPITTASATLLAAMRLVYLIGIACVYIVRLDTSLFPAELVGLDAGFCSYMSAMLVVHRHQSPVWKSFELVTEQSHEQSHKGEVTARQRAIRRWNVALTLMNNPRLIKERRSQQEEASPSETKVMPVIRPDTADEKPALPFKFGDGTDGIDRIRQSPLSVLIYQEHHL